MPLYVRKSLTRGPIRLNLSKHGLGASFGVTGLRIGVGPKGTYIHAGREGLYYRKYLDSNSSVPYVPAPPRAVSAPESEAESLEFVAVPATDDEVAAAINQRLSAFRWSGLIFAAAFILPLVIVAGRLYILAALAFVGFLIWAITTSNHENKKRRIELHYDLPEVVGKCYDVFVRAFEEAAKCSAIWRVTSQTASRDTKYTAGAGTTVERSRTSITFNDTTIVTNLATPWLLVAGGKLAMLPDRMLFFGPTGVTSLNYKDVMVAGSLMNFREDGPVPPDSANVGSTWQYVNKSGDPDKRFTNNRKLPIQQYSDFQFTHPRLSFRLEFSRAAVADVLAKAIDAIREVNSAVNVQVAPATKLS